MDTDRPDNPPCDHEWEFVDASFDHEFGTHQDYFYYCDLCGDDRDVTAADMNAAAEAYEDSLS